MSTKGSAFDFRQYKNRIIQALYNFGVYKPNLAFLISKVNEEDTLADIDILADRLVNEITQYVDEQAMVVKQLRCVLFLFFINDISSSHLVLCVILWVGS